VAEPLEVGDEPSGLPFGVLEHANEKMSIDIGTLTEALLEEFGDRLGDDGRINDVRIEVRHSLNALANRIDEGYSIEIRAGSFLRWRKARCPRAFPRRRPERLRSSRSDRLAWAS
jgi:hypothetical protein